MPPSRQPRLRREAARTVLLLNPVDPLTIGMLTVASFGVALGSAASLLTLVLFLMKPAPVKR